MDMSNDVCFWQPADFRTAPIVGYEGVSSRLADMDATADVDPNQPLRSYGSVVRLLPKADVNHAALGARNQCTSANTRSTRP